MLPIQRKISSYNYYNGNDIKYIVVHYIGATGTAKNNVDYFYGGDRQASAHYFVGLNEVWQSVEDFNGAWHVGNTRTEVNNKNSIGVEMECANPNLYVEDKTIQNTCELIAYLMKKYNISLSNVRTHYEVAGKSKLCPNFANTSRWSDMKNKIQTEYNKLINQSNNNNKEEILMQEYIVQYSNDTDKAVAEHMADRLYCPTINCAARPFKYYGHYKTVIAVGVAENKSGHTNVEIKGSNRAETMDKAIAWLKSIGR